MKKPNHFLKIMSNELAFDFIETGDVFEMKAGSFFINQFRGNAFDGSVNNIYLRIYENDQVKAFTPLLGQKSNSTISYQKHAIHFWGEFFKVSYHITLFLSNNSWFYEIELDSKTPVMADLMYSQDIGLSQKAGVLSNELYISQYIGHHVFSSESGYRICSRQNMQDAGSNPYVEQGCLTHKIISYATDGLDFFGLSYKKDHQPIALTQGLSNRILQYEFANIALQTEVFCIQGKEKVVFYGHFIENHPDKVTSLCYENDIKENYSKRPDFSDVLNTANPFTIKKQWQAPFISPGMSKDTLDALFPEKNLVETKDGTLFSFFTPAHTHVVTQEKEVATLRPHGSIVMTPCDDKEIADLSTSLISSTHYMYGIFNSHVVYGNTNLHKFISSPRGFLNIQTNSGQRVYVKIKDAYRLLELPCLFEMGMNFSRWFYIVEDDLLILTSYSTHPTDTDQTSKICLEIKSQKGKTYDFVVTNQLTHGEHEYEANIEASLIPNGLRFPFATDHYKTLAYEIYALEPCTLSDDRIFYNEEKAFDETLLTMSFCAQSNLHIVMQGSYKDFAPQQEIPSFETETKHALDAYASIMKQFHLSSKSDPSNQALLTLEETTWWYTHNAMIHFRMPHGLEQPGGAAWGTRDICQGPMEYFLATGNYAAIRSILLNIFAHQEYATKEWPQWFMFDSYEMNAGECHGDVIFWPLKSIADYLLKSRDYQILEELLPYADQKEKKESLLSHIQAAFDEIKRTRFVGDTGLITYAGGDWDDTLQPINEELKQHLVSTWTQALAYQTMHLLSDALKTSHSSFSKEIKDLSLLIKKAFLTYAIQDEVIAGFLEIDEHISPLLHPQDKKTGIHYRLLPQTRSILAELADQEQAKKNTAVIDKNLSFSDGVRLMDHPAWYDGGVSHLFKRAEQAANVGREISLQYTHAHIRYIEAMAKLGDSKKAWRGLFQINPILIQDTVPHANIRQSNMYFSSSEGDFINRYEYQEHFNLLKEGNITLKGGWRLYSSGPGIYMHQVISHILGIRFTKDTIILDPVLPDTLPDFSLQLSCFDTLCTFHFKKQTDSVLKICSDEKQLNSVTLEQPYRKGGIAIEKDTFLASKSKEYTIYYTL